MQRVLVYFDTVPIQYGYQTGFQRNELTIAMRWAVNYRGGALCIAPKGLATQGGTKQVEIPTLQKLKLLVSGEEVVFSLAALDWARSCLPTKCWVRLSLD